MLATFVIGLREGLEASLIVGIIATFLKRQDRTDALRQVWVGVGVAVTLCLAAGITLKLASQNLPQRQQEGLETVVGAAAVLMVTAMLVWMRRHAPSLKRDLEGAATAALANGSATALVGMAFLAVLREGLETAVFLLAAFDASTNPATAVVGAALGIAAAVGLGWGIYRGGVRLNLAKFFRATSVVLVLVAAGLVVTAFHTAHEAGWLNAGQQSTVDLSWLVRPGTVRSSLLTGMLGLQPRPVLIEVVAWLAYLVPVGAFVLLPPGRQLLTRRTSTALAGLAGALAVAAAVVAVTAPASAPDRARDVVAQTRTTSTLLTPDAPSQQLLRLPSHGLRPAGSTVVDGLRVDRMQSAASGAVTSLAGQSLPAELSRAQLTTAGGGHLPIGIPAAELTRSVPTTYVATSRSTWLVEPRSGDVVSVTARDSVTALVHLPTGVLPLTSVATVTRTTPAAAVTAAARTAAADRAADRAHGVRGQQLPIGLGAAAVLCLLLAGLGRVTATRRRQPVTAPPTTSPSPVPAAVH